METAPARPAGVGDSLNRQLLRMGAMLQLERRARRCAREELPFVMVNETNGLLPYQQALLWQGDGSGGGRIAAVSGLAVFDATGPYLAWAATVCRHLLAKPSAEGGDRPRVVRAGDLPPDLVAAWAEWLPAEAVWAPLPGPAAQTPDGLRLGGLLLARAEPWSEADLHLLDYLADAYAHAWVAKEAKLDATAWLRGRRRLRRGAVVAAVAAALVLLLPVRQSALAPAEVVPRAPTLVRSPLTGVVERIHVQPNQPVAAGDLLLTLDPTELTTKLNVAVKARDVALAEYTQAAQLAVFDPEAKARLAVLEARLAQQELEVGFLRDMLGRVAIRAPEAGVAVFDDPNDWLGRPVSQGERVMLVADPGRVELEIRLSAGDAVTLQPGAAVQFFPNVAPAAPDRGTVSFVGYAASPGPDGVLSYRLKADLEADGDLRIGQRGTAKVFGPRAPLILALLRRPLATVRQWLAI